MKFEKPEDFYGVYAAHRVYVRAEVRKKHVAEFSRNIWQPAGFRAGHRVLEIGCGTGLFLAFLKSQGVHDLTGVEPDAKARDFMPADIAAQVHTIGLEDFLKQHSGGPFDRIVMLDVFEHFSVFDGVAVLQSLKPLLGPDGRLVLRVPNCASPWGLQYQLGDLTHKAMYTPGNMQHVALAAGYAKPAFYPYRRGSTVRRAVTAAIEGGLSRALTDPPPIWSANFLTVMKPQD